MRATLFTILLSVGLLTVPALAVPQDSAHTQVVRGKVVDVVTGSPLTGATARLYKDSAVVKGDITDSKGQFEIKNVPLGRMHVQVTFLGYEPYAVEDILITAGKEVVLLVEMKESFATAEAIGVEYDRITDVAITNNEFVTVSGRPFNTEDTKRYAGALGDPSRMAANFAGVVGANDSRNDIIVRGNSPGNMLWRMDGLNIPNPNHFGSLSSTGGPVSMLNNNVLQKSDFITSAFPAMYGNGLSGVFDIKLREGNTKTHEFMTQMGFNGLEGGAEGPLWEGASYLVNYRYSTLALFDELGLDVGTGGATPNYQDLTFKFQTPVGQNGKVEVFGVGGQSDISFLAKERDTTQNQYYSDEDRNTLVQYRTGWTGASYELRFGTSTTAKVTVGGNATFEKYAGDSVDMSTGEEVRDEEAQFETQTVSVVADLRHKFSRTTNMVAGLFVDRQHYDLYNATNLDQATPSVRVRSDGSATSTQGFVQLQHRFYDWLSVNAGVNALHYTAGNAFAVEPRLGVRAMVSPSLSLTGGYGLHSRRQALYTYNVQTFNPTGYTLTNQDLSFTKSHHGVIGMDWSVSTDIRIKAEAYYQSIFDAPVTANPSYYSALNSGSDFAPDNTDSLVNNGTGRNVGIELTAEHFFRNGFYFLLTASVFDSKYTGSDGIERNTAFNTNYVVNVLAGKEIRLGQNFVLFGSGRFSTTGGRYLTPIDEEASAIAGEAVYDYSQAYSQRQDPYLRLDIKLGFRMEFSRSSLEFALDLQNVTNHQNIFSQGYDPRTGRITTEYQQGFFPIPMVKYTF